MENKGTQRHATPGMVFGHTCTISAIKPHAQNRARINPKRSALERLENRNRVEREAVAYVMRHTDYTEAEIDVASWRFTGEESHAAVILTAAQWVSNKRLN